MNIILMCSSQGNQKSLAHKIAKVANLSDIILVDGYEEKKTSALSYLYFYWHKVCTILTCLRYRSMWFGMLNYYDSRYSDFPIEPAIKCNNVNDSVVIDRIAKFKPDLVIVSGTNLLKDTLIDEIHKYGKIINLHTGISPYVKGGPNCTNWCLALREFGLIGNTVMWLNVGIDAGNLIATERTPITGSESMLELHIAVMEHAHDLYVRCIQKFIRGETLPNVSQNDFPQKRLFLSKHWGLYPMIMGLVNYYSYYHKNSKYLDIPCHIKLVELAK